MEAASSQKPNSALSNCATASAHATKAMIPVTAPSRAGVAPETAPAIAEAAPFDPAARAASPDACAVAALRLPRAAFSAFLCRSPPAAFLAACPALYMPEAPSSSSESSNWETASRAVASFAASTRERIAAAARRSPAG